MSAPSLLSSVAVNLKATPRYQAYLTLQAIAKGAYADVALSRVLHQSPLSAVDRGLVTELVYGTVRRQRTLDVLIDHLCRQRQQPLNLRLILRLGLYQLRYLGQIPAAAAVNTSVELAKGCGLTGLAGVVNGVLRAYLRISQDRDPLPPVADPLLNLAVQESFPDWIVQAWVGQLDLPETTALCQFFNQPPTLDLRVNSLQVSPTEVLAALASAKIKATPIANLPGGIRLGPGLGAIAALPGYDTGWWSVQDAAAQLVTHLLDPQPGETIIDACAAPGGKTTHIAELMQDRGTVIALDRVASRLRKLKQNQQRLQLTCLQAQLADSTQVQTMLPLADRVLVDAPCSGLGTLHRHADARWRQTPTTLAQLVSLQSQLLQNAATWVKPGGIMVYATCSLHPDENQEQIANFLQTHPHWHIAPLPPTFPRPDLQSAQGWLQAWPQRQQMDGFFMVRLQRDTP
ncbi:16S rRNA (cytosine(967)-C(5))-methyltransferase [Thermosynechococcaceae cyanobacterium BACA0444]|uniref:16S rRNA (cytosine(967)-C(5))-methyltransferase n=1 Tax=Pseudocalidococcus azoricus BACA0444 TaxID=2918990 RepID=A0AAE4FS93_9CYAN|nr:16S rRNA (cytosine(967)-C(5))-methyltransferase [Pseudocalidococcus azoricus]MDS3861349.1 16S rRNA (cytosine(967)-C(5))-methyltransferase [Pseudocalidococcus azoricus BACA0444]